MGQFKDYDGGVTFFDVGLTSDFLAYPDHGLIYRFMPRSVQSTDMEVIWLVRADARAGVDYDVERLTWLWRVTSVADKRIIELNQQGINSRYYEPGPSRKWSRHAALRQLAAPGIAVGAITARRRDAVCQSAERQIYAVADDHQHQPSTENQLRTHVFGGMHLCIHRAAAPCE